MDWTVSYYKHIYIVEKGTHELELPVPSTMKVHSVFHVSLLRLYRSDGRVVQPPDRSRCLLRWW